ncbi:MAG: APC family permease [Proteobacteria bacterium]|nr:APC family permease [Pseudomonadota bacterium]
MESSRTGGTTTVVNSPLESTNPIRKLLFGKAIPTEHHEHTRLPKWLALPVFASDAISSSVYATQEILLALATAGAGALMYTVHISVAIVLLLVIVAFSYRQTVYAYAQGGGSYIVAKDNLGVRWGLIAAAAILIDYILTVATSIASGVQNLVAVPFMHGFKGHEVFLCVSFIVLLSILNLRGLKESGAIFAVPTYMFIACALTMLFFGFFGPSLFGWTLNPADPPLHPIEPTTAVGIALFLNAFSRGCSALTGTEAISDGVPAFRVPQSRNAATTLVWMAVILGVLFMGMSLLAARTGVVYVEGSAPVVDQLNSIVFGKGTWFYYVLQMSTVAILVLAANTSFADFPRLSAVLARDGFMPRQLSNLGDKLTFSNGIIMLGVLSSVLVIVFRGNTDLLIPLYAIGVFIAFTLSQTGMVARWARERSSGWLGKAIINGIGATATFLVMCTIAYEKIIVDIVHNQGREFGWIIAILIGLLYAMFRAIEQHYASMKTALSTEGYEVPASPRANTVLVLIPRVHRGVLAALEYCRRIGSDVRGVHISVTEEDLSPIKESWERWAPDVPLVVLNSPYRSIISPLLSYLDEVERERPDTYITVVVPESVSSRWWHGLLHANYGAWIKLYLLRRKNVILTNVRYFPFEDEPSKPVPPGAADAPDVPASIPAGNGTP